MQNTMAGHLADGQYWRMGILPSGHMDKQTFGQIKFLIVYFYFYLQKRYIGYKDKIITYKFLADLLRDKKY